MTKKYFHTYDIFNGIANTKNCYDFCHSIALKSGLSCKCYIEDVSMKLELWGSKQQFIKYYIRTITKCYKFEGVKRLISMIFS